MGAFEVVVGAGLLAIVSFQVWLTWRVFQSNLFERKQKIWQAQLIWLLPVIGAGLVFSVLRDDEKPQRSAELLRDNDSDRS